MRWLDGITDSMDDWHCIFVAACGLSLVAESGRYSLVVVHELLIVMASLVVEHKL